MITRYSSRRESIAGSLLNKKLKNAKSYDRIAGYFSSSIFEVAGENLDKIDGKIRVICNSEVRPEDVKTAKKAKKAIRQEWCNNQPEELDLKNYRFKKLYEYLKNGKLEVRILPNREFGLIHGKAGVITYENGNKTSFLGSVNESKSGWQNNYELVWEDNSKESVEWVQEEFEALWNHPSTIELPDFIIKDIRRIYKRTVIENEEDIKKTKNLPAAANIETPIFRKELGLWEHQKYFIEKIFKEHRKNNGARYVLADPVGLGKTLQLGISAQLMALYGDKPVLIIAPKSLMKQWQEELNELVNIPTARWDGLNWIDENGVKYSNNGRKGVLKCPRKIGIISQGLVTAKSKTVEYLKNKEFECVVVDETHHARRKFINPNNNFYKFEKTNLYNYLLELSSKTKSMLLATATPIQLHPIELWDLLNILGKGSEKVLGSKNSLWRKKGTINTGLELVKNQGNDLSKVEKWRWIKNPFPSSNECVNYSLLRTNLNIKEKESVFKKTYYELEANNKAIADFIINDFFKLHNPFIRNVIRRERKYLEEKINPETKEPYLEKIKVHMIEEPPITLTGYMRDAYQYAEEFCQLIARRAKGGSFLKTLLLKRIGSSLEAGKKTGLRLEKNWNTGLDTEKEDSDIEEKSEIKNLTKEEIELLNKYVNALLSNKAEDPKLMKIKELLNRKNWIKEGVIIFSQYFDTVEWMANQISKEFKDEKIGIYAGSNKSGYFLNDKFHIKSKEDIKKMVKDYEVKILFGTDAASEGLNLQSLRRLINIDLPWNPTRLEQRKGRIQRSGQRFSDIYIYNMRYENSVEDRVHELLSERLKDITAIFGQLPDILEDVWIEIALNEKEKAKQIIKKIPDKHPFEIKYNDKVSASDWESCTEVLSEELKQRKLKEGW